jgi:hypothetical protein
MRWKNYSPMFIGGLTNLRHLGGLTREFWAVFEENNFWILQIVDYRWFISASERDPSCVAETSFPWGLG